MFLHIIYAGELAGRRVEWSWQRTGPADHRDAASRGAVVPCPARAATFDQVNGGAAHQVERRSGLGDGVAGCPPWRRCRAGAAKARGIIDMAADIPGSY